jgi:hypothetical protein
VHMLIDEAAGGDVQAGAAVALNGGAALYLLCLTVCQQVSARHLGAPERTARALAGAALVLAAAVSGLLSPVAFVAISAATLGGLVVYELTGP